MLPLFYNKNQKDQIQYYSQHNPQVLNGKFIQNTIGLIAIVWPAVLIFGHWVSENSFALQDSVSAYYHTNMGHIFSGGLFVTGVCMLAYKGYHCVDGWIGNVAGSLAILVALFPTDIGENDLLFGTSCNMIHYASAFSLFLCLAYFCIYIFTLSPKENINRRYRFCGWLILFFIGGMIASKFAFSDSEEPKCYSNGGIFLILEILTLWVFGYSWLLKANPMGIFRKNSSKDNNKDLEKSKKKMFKAYNEKYEDGPEIKSPDVLLTEKLVVKKCHMPE